MSHLYIHIPFCESKCSYCSFNSESGYKNETIKSYFIALEQQLKYEFERFNLQKESLKTIYFGGGTPSAAHFSNYEKIFDLLSKYMSSDIEVTLEANPNSATRRWLKELYALGANRLSIGVQSFDQEKLKFLGRIHSTKQVKNALANAKEIGFENISIDIIYDTHFDNLVFVENEIKNALEQPISHISAYSLTIEEDSGFAGKHELKNENLNSAKRIFELLNENGMEQYEVSNFGKIRSQHNTAYWMARDYIGAGAGAVGFLKDSRFYPHTNIEKYISEPTYFDIENISADELRFERVFLGLRSAYGVSLDDIKNHNIDKVERLIKEEKVKQVGERLVAVDFLLADGIALYLED